MEIQEIKTRLNIVEVAKHLGIEINPRTKRALCPFHNDKSPSLQFSIEKQIATCFSSNCNLGTVDMIGLTERVKNLNTHEALKYLSELAGETKPNHEPKQPVLLEPEQVARLAFSEVERIAVLKKTFSFFENALIASSPARKYLESRNLDLQQIKAGYQTGTLHHGENKHLIEGLEQIGLLKKINSGHAPFGLGCIVFPLRNKKNEITGLYFRAVEPRPGKFAGRHYEKHLYLKNRQGLYPNYPKPNTTKLLISESIIDTATLQQIPSITEEYELLSSYGTNGITEEHKSAIKELTELEEIILFFDGDQAGKEGSKARAKELHELLPGTCGERSRTIKISIVATPEGEDINSLSIGHTPELFTELLQNRTPFIFQKNTSIESSIEEKKVIEPVSTASPSAATNSQTTHKTELNTSNPYKIILATETAAYYIKGGIPKALDSMKVTVEIENITTSRKSRQKFDLYEDKQTEKAAREAGEKLGIRADLIEMDLNYLTDLLDDYREQQIKENEPTDTSKKVTVPQEQQIKCISFLKQNGLIQKFNQLIEKAGITGETNNRIFLFVIATAYKMPDTLHALIQGSSGSGKTYLSKQITDLMPKEDVIRLTRVTESSFYNFGEYEIQYKLIVLEDVDGLKEEADYAFRELQSNGYITSGVSAKNENSGYFNTIQRIVRGPIGSIVTTTKGEIYEDNMSRIFLLAVDESKEQTGRIIEYLNQKSSGMINKTEERETKHFIQNCIRMLRPYEVVNPYANKILLPPQAHKIRRLTELFHSFVNQITLINQYQRKKDQQGRLITEKEDVQTAIEIMFESIILKIDELDGSLRQFYEDLKTYIIKQGEEYQNYQFTQREIRQALNVSKTQLQRYMRDLIELEYISQNGTGYKGAFTYKINYWDNIKALRDRIKYELQQQLNKF